MKELAGLILANVVLDPPWTAQDSCQQFVISRAPLLSATMGLTILMDGVESTELMKDNTTVKWFEVEQ